MKSEELCTLKFVQAFRFVVIFRMQLAAFYNLQNEQCTLESVGLSVCVQNICNFVLQTPLTVQLLSY